MALIDLPVIDPLTRGDDEEIGFFVVEPGEDPTDPEAPRQNLSGCVLRFSAKFDLSDPQPIVTKISSDNNEITIDDSLQGEGTIYINQSDLTAVTYETTLIADLEVTDATSKRYTIRFRVPVELDVSV
jgi:hypothetical protein